MDESMNSEQSIGDSYKILIAMDGLDSINPNFELNGFKLKNALIQDQKLKNCPYSSFYEADRRSEKTSDLNIDNPRNYIYFEKKIEKRDRNIIGEDGLALVDTLNLIGYRNIKSITTLLSKNGDIERSESYQSYKHSHKDTGKLTDYDTKSLEEFYNKVLDNRRANNRLTKMISFFVNSSYLSDPDMEFILEIVILEMLCDNEKSGNVTERLARSVGALLGTDEKSSKEIYTKMKKIYDARSEFIHDGNWDKISEDYIDTTDEYVRRCLIKLLNFNDDKLKEIEKTIIPEPYFRESFSDSITKNNPEG
jgi:hypothetical protein